MRRLFWLAFGLGAGATGASSRRVGHGGRSNKAKPATIAREAKGGLLDLSKLVAESIEEGRRAMEERERELRRDGRVHRPRARPDAPGAA